MVVLMALLSSCGTTDSAGSSSDSQQQPATSGVPGEKVVNDNQVMPSATSGMPGASIGW